MKSILLILLATVSLASARIGETVEQLEKRYGKPTLKTATRTFYEKDGVRIIVAMWKDRCHMILFEPMLSAEQLAKVPPPAVRKLTKDEIQSYLAHNPEGATWEPLGPGVIFTTDKKFMATTSDSRVVIQTMDYHREHPE